jgi:predicted AlkP superfamily pyrophosphatase or phosphodiesterase
MRYLLFTSVIALTLLTLKSTAKAQDQPQLVVGIVVDQMRPDYLSRYWNKFGEGGFKRLINQGYSLTNTHYTYVPTYTAPGHATIYTGTTPSGHGIISNDWFSRDKGDIMYCVEDKSVNTVRSVESISGKQIPRQMMPEKFKNKAGQMSPRNMISTTLGDELRLHSNMRSKVVGVALKDRGSILPAGHLGDAYWFDGESGDWISSTYYGEKLPDWVNEFNARKLTESYLSGSWNTLLPIEEYKESLADDSPFEGLIKGKKKPVFPYNLKELSAQNGMGLIRATPFGNTLTTDIALAALKGENLGKRGFCDLLSISYSSTDIIGHTFGINAIETQDTYLRLDKDLERLFDFLDNWVGMENCLIFLSSDHGGAHNPSYLQSIKIPAGYLRFDGIGDSLRTAVKVLFGAENLILSLDNNQLYFNHNEIAAQKINYSALEAYCVQFIEGFKGVQQVYNRSIITTSSCADSQIDKVKKGFMPGRSGDLFIVMEPSWMDYPPTGTTHGSNHSYDTHVPLIFMGWKVKSGKSRKFTGVEDIAPTIAQLLNIAFPNASSGNVIELQIKE